MVGRRPRGHSCRGRLFGLEVPIYNADFLCPGQLVALVESARHGHCENTYFQIRREFKSCGMHVSGDATQNMGFTTAWVAVAARQGVRPQDPRFSANETLSLLAWTL